MAFSLTAITSSSLTGRLFSRSAPGSHAPSRRCSRCAPHPPPGAAQVRLQQPPVGVRIAAHAVGALVREALPRAPLGSLDRAPHLCRRREAQPPGEHGGDPFRLSFHHRDRPPGVSTKPAKYSPPTSGGAIRRYSGKSRPLATSSEE